MSDLKNVTITLKANQYFDGNVTSRTVHLQNGSRLTLGIMQPGVYEFDTQHAERIEILDGKVKVTLSDVSKPFLSIQGGGSFNVPANSRFTIKAITLVDYCCSYLSGTGS